MKIEKHIIGLVLLILFMGVGYADDNNANKSKIVYGSYDEGTEIRQKDIDELEKKYSKKLITLVWALYEILNDNWEWVDKSVFEEMLKLQTDSWITISYLADDLWVSDEVIGKIKTNSYLINWLWIDVDWKTVIAKYQASHQANQGEWTWEEINEKNQAEWTWEEINEKNQAEWTWKEINAKNQAATRENQAATRENQAATKENQAATKENQAVNNIALWH